MLRLQVINDPALSSNLCHRSYPNLIVPCETSFNSWNKRRSPVMWLLAPLSRYHIPLFITYSLTPWSKLTFDVYIITMRKGGLCLLLDFSNLNFLHLLTLMTFISKVSKFLVIITFYLGLVMRPLFISMIMLFAITSTSSSSSSPSAATASSKRATFFIFLWFPRGSMMKQDRKVVENTRSRVRIITKLTISIKLSRIKKYSGE